MTEEWKEIPGYDGYEVSSLGRVRSWRPSGPRTGRRLVEPTILKLKTGGKQNLYLRVILGRGGPTRSVHRLVAEAFVPGQAPGLEAAHENGNIYDNRAENLRWKTRKENVADQFRHGTLGKKLTYEEVEAIRAIYVRGQITYKEIGEMFGINASSVGKIILRQRWNAA